MQLDIVESPLLCWQDWKADIRVVSQRVEIGESVRGKDVYVCHILHGLDQVAGVE